MNILQACALLITGASFGYEVYILSDFIKMKVPFKECFVIVLAALVELGLFIGNLVCIGVRLI